MSRSSGLPTGRLRAGMTRIIRSRARSVTIKRPTKTKNSLDDTVETIDEHIENIWLFQPQENISQELTGERINGSLGGLLVAERGVNVQKDDRVVHGGIEYEVDTVVGHPEDTNADGGRVDGTDFFVISFVRRN